MVDTTIQPFINQPKSKDNPWPGGGRRAERAGRPHSGRRTRGGAEVEVDRGGWLSMVDEWLIQSQLVEECLTIKG